MADIYSQLDQEAGVVDYASLDKEAGISFSEGLTQEIRQFGLETQKISEQVKPEWEPGTVGATPVDLPDLHDPANLQDPDIFSQALRYTDSEEKQRQLAKIRNDYFAEQQAAKAGEMGEQVVAQRARAQKGFLSAFGKSIRSSSARVVSGIAGVMADYITKDFIPEASQAREHYRELSERADLTPSEGGTAEYLGDLIGGTLPYMATAIATAGAGGVAVAGGVVGGLSTVAIGRFLGGAFTGYAVEGEDAYQNVLKSGGTVEEAELERKIVGSINALIEASQVSHVFKFAGAAGKTSLKLLISAVRDRAYKTLAKEGGRFSIRLLALAFREGVEEWMQENVSQITPAILRGDYPKKTDGSPDYWAMFKRSGSAFLGGAIVGGILGVGGTTATRQGGELIEGISQQTGIAPEESRDVVIYASQQVDTEATPEQQNEQLTGAILNEIDIQEDKTAVQKIELGDVTDQASLEKTGATIIKFLGVEGTFEWVYNNRAVKRKMGKLTVVDSKKKKYRVTIYGKHGRHQGISGQEELIDTIVEELGHAVKPPFRKQIIKLPSNVKIKRDTTQDDIYLISQGNKIWNFRAKNRKEAEKYWIEWQNSMSKRTIHHPELKQWIAESVLQILEAKKETVTVYEGKAFRTPTGTIIKGTAADVVRFEQEELGNDLGVTDDQLEQLKKRPASDIVWVTREKVEAARYAQEDVGDEVTTDDLAAVEEVDIAGGSIIADIGADGVLVLKPKEPVFIPKITPVPADEAVGKQYGLAPVETSERLSKAELQYRELKNKPVSERTRAEQKELAFLKHNKTNIEAILKRETEPIEKKMSKKEALALGHSIPESLGWTEEQRRDFNKKITNQSSMKNMTSAQRKQLIVALTKEAEKAGIEMDGLDTSPMDELLTKLAERKQKPALTQRDRRNMKKLRKIYYTMKSGTSFYFLHMSRIKRLSRALDNYQTDGPFMKYIYQPVKDADTKAAVNFSAIMDAALRSFEDLDIDVPTMFSEVKDIGIEDKLSTAERIGVWALAQNEKTKNHLRSEFTNKEIDMIVKSVEANEKDMLVAAEIQAYFEIGWDQLKRIAEAHGISGLVKEENYITAFVKNKDDVVDTEFMSGLLQEFTQGAHVPGEQHTIERKPGAKRNLELNVFMIHARAARSIERFKVMAPVADKVGQMLKHKGLKSDLNDATYGHGARLFDKWLQDSIRGQSAYETSAIGAALRWLRTRSVHYVLGAKIITAAKQGISLFPAMGVHPGMVPLILANIAHIPFGAKFKAMHAEINAKSEMMRHRDWDRDLRQTYDQKAVKKLYAGKKLSPILMRMATWVDRHTAGAVWYSAYQLSQKHNMNEKDSVKFANGVVEDTQPMGKAVDLPAFFRGSELEKNFSIFQNQVNQNGNMLWYDTLGEAKARNISIKMLGYRLLMQQIVPALLLGMVSRGRLPEDFGEIGKDLAFYMMSPYFFVGRFLYNTFIARDWGPMSGFIWETPLTETYRFAGAAMGNKPVSYASWGATKQREWDQKRLKDVAKYGARAIGAWTGGYPPLQVVQTVEGGWNLATDNTDDFRELIWSKYALKKKGKKKDERATGYYQF